MKILRYSQTACLAISLSIFKSRYKREKILILKKLFRESRHQVDLLGLVSPQPFPIW